MSFLLRLLASLATRLRAFLTSCPKPPASGAQAFARPVPPKPLAVSAVPPWLTFSARELGTKEIPGTESTPRIFQYRELAGCELKGDDGDVPWCRIYVCAMLALAKLPYRKDWMARAVERDSNFVRLEGPALGAICSFWRGSRSGGLGHTGFYWGESKGRVLVEGGNESDAVRRAFFPKNGSLMGLVGYYWPKSLPLPKIGPIKVDDDGRPIRSAT
jgi:uncharacterized protein (TIGR02594 family)